MSGHAEHADALVMLGVMGDLGEQKLFPAIVELARADVFGGPIVGVGRSERTDDDMREKVARAAADIDDDGTEVTALVEPIDIGYVSGDATDAATFDTVASRLGDVRRPVVYASLPPDLFGSVAAAVAASGLPDTTRLVVEKPFGSDAADARRLHREITAEIDAERLFVVDHFLAKSSIENLLTFRCANPMIDSLMHTGHVDRIEITMAEEFGVDGRESFYDDVGALADVMQNHLLQLVAVLTMESPSDGSEAAFDRSRAELMSSIRPLEPSDVVLGQFDGYTDADEIDGDSATETFAAVRLAIDNERWRGVPVVVRTGKRLAATVTQAVVVFEGGATPNRLRFGIKPDSSVVLELGVLDPTDHGVRPTELTACAPGDHGPLGDYATMLADAVAGERRHFAGIDGIAAAWRVIDPIRSIDLAPETYEPGSWGPAAADRLVGDAWAPLV